MSLLSARARAHALRQAKAEEAHPGTITISGTSYDCAALINRIDPTPTEKGYEEVQTARVDLRKALCATCPTRADSFTLGGYNNWKLIATGGQNATDLAWVLTLHRRVKP